MNTLDTLKYICENSEYVSINQERILEFINNNSNWNYNYWLEDLKKSLNEKECIIFAFLCESINFCFWGNENYNENYIGSETIFYKIKEKVLNKSLSLNIKSLIDITESEFNDIFGDSYKEIPLMHQRYILFKNTIYVIYSKKEKFFNEIFSFNQDLDLLNYITSNFTDFEDKSIYKGKQINFNKRATLLVNDLFWLSDTVRRNLNNLNNLTGCADYALPRLLLENEILIYNEDLLKTIMDKNLIPHNSLMEIEIRANTLYVIESIKQILASRNININSIELDNIIWRMRTNYNHKIPVHRTLTICY